MENILLESERLTKSFFPPLSFGKFVKFGFRQPEPIKALVDVSFILKKGKVFGVIGPNGAGKTTLLKIIATLILPDKGRIRVKNYTLGKDDEEIKSLVGLATSEERSFYWRLSGRQNLELFATLYGLKNKEAKTRINRLLKLFKIDYMDRRFDTYSTGMKRKFSLVRALLHEPEILLLDEPTKSLDYNSACELRNFIKKQPCAGKSVIIASHNMEEIQDMCDSFMLLYQGQVIGLGTQQELRNKVNLPSASLAEIYLKFIGNA